MEEFFKIIAPGALIIVLVGVILYLSYRGIKTLLVRRSGAKLKFGAVEIDTKSDDVVIYKLVCINQLYAERFGETVKSAERILSIRQASAEAMRTIKDSVIPQQMRKVELVLDDATRVMKQAHLDAIVQKTGKSEDEMRHSPQQYWYSTRIDSIYYVLKDELRRVMHENHLAGKGAEEIQEYCRGKVQSLFTLVSQHIDSTWDNSILTVEEIRSVQASKMPLYGEYLFKMIIDCWKISKDTANAIYVEEQTLKAKIEAEEKIMSEYELLFKTKIDAVIKSKDMAGCDFVTG